MWCYILCVKGSSSNIIRVEVFSFWKSFPSMMVNLENRVLKDLIFENWTFPPAVWTRNSKFGNFPADSDGSDGKRRTRRNRMYNARQNGEMVVYNAIMSMNNFPAARRRGTQSSRPFRPFLSGRRRRRRHVANRKSTHSVYSVQGVPERFVRIPETAPVMRLINSPRPFGRGRGT